ncbi:MAG: glycerate kinase type-2 family protein [Janthinobacterium lividum]
MSAHLKNVARAIFADALQAIDVRSAVLSRIAQRDGVLTLAGRSIPSAEIDRIVIIAMGKAAVAMYMAAAEALAGIEHTAVVVGPKETLPIAAVQNADLHGGRGSNVTFLPGAHPTPTIQSLEAADVILRGLAAVTSRTVVLFLISGGASAMVEKPLDPAITLDDLAMFSRALVGSGLDIAAMNTLRKHLSAVKGGRLAKAAERARMQCTLLISDVPEAAPDAVGSGPSLPDSTTVAETRMLVRVLRRSTYLPQSITAWFEEASLPETPRARDAVFSRAHWEVLLSSEHLARAARGAAENAGFHAVLDNACDDWDYREAGRYLLGRSAALSREAGQPTCLISVGEVGVVTSLQAGEGGRNQQFALWCADALADRKHVATVLSAGTDGIDGHSSAAGAVCDEETVSRAGNAGLSVREALEGFNTAPLLHALGDALYTGPTGNNLRDLRLILTDGD